MISWSTCLAQDWSLVMKEWCPFIYWPGFAYFSYGFYGVLRSVLHSCAAHSWVKSGPDLINFQKGKLTLREGGEAPESNRTSELGKVGCPQPTYYVRAKLRSSPTFAPPPGFCCGFFSARMLSESYSSISPETVHCVLWSFSHAGTFTY